jgi:hypothetical protein
MATVKTKAKTSADVKALRDVPKGIARSLRIKSLPDTFWRGGIKHTKAGANIAIEELSNEQLIAIMAEPKLSVEVVDEEAKAES